MNQEHLNNLCFIEEQFEVNGVNFDYRCTLNTDTGEIVMDDCVDNENGVIATSIEERMILDWTRENYYERNKA